MTCVECQRNFEVICRNDGGPGFRFCPLCGAEFNEAEIQQMAEKERALDRKLADQHEQYANRILGKKPAGAS